MRWQEIAVTGAQPELNLAMALKIVIYQKAQGYRGGESSKRRLQC